MSPKASIENAIFFSYIREKIKNKNTTLQKIPGNKVLNSSEHNFKSFHKIQRVKVDQTTAYVI
jgi:hypothetical protein